jgi:hypothetical protein
MTFLVLIAFAVATVLPCLALSLVDRPAAPRTSG